MAPVEVWYVGMWEATMRPSEAKRTHTPTHAHTWRDDLATKFDDLGLSKRHSGLSLLFHEVQLEGIDGIDIDGNLNSGRWRNRQNCPSNGFRNQRNLGAAERNLVSPIVFHFFEGGWVGTT